VPAPLKFLSLKAKIRIIEKNVEKYENIGYNNKWMVNDET